MNLIFIGPFKHAGLSLSIGLGACLNASLLYWQLRKQKIFQPQPGWAIFLTKLVIGVIAMSAVLLGLLWVMPDWDVGGMAYRLLRLSAVLLQVLLPTLLCWHYWALKCVILPVERADLTNQLIN